MGDGERDDDALPPPQLSSFPSPTTPIPVPFVPKARQGSGRPFQTGTGLRDRDGTRQFDPSPDVNENALQSLMRLFFSAISLSHSQKLAFFLCHTLCRHATTWEGDRHSKQGRKTACITCPPRLLLPPAYLPPAIYICWRRYGQGLEWSGQGRIKLFTHTHALPPKHFTTHLATSHFPLACLPLLPFPPPPAPCLPCAFPAHPHAFPIPQPHHCLFLFPT